VNCASCGAVNQPLARFCNSCGAPLAGPASKAAPPSARKTVTALFCDVTGSTQLGEQLDPESLKEVLTRYFVLARRLIEQHGGTVEKFIGDAVMAVFGVPVVHEDDALRAVLTSWAIMESMVSLNSELARDFGTTLQVRIGVDTGEAITDVEELAIGDTVNTAARLEQAAKPGQILIGEQTMQLTREAVEAVPVEPLRLTGKSRPVPAYDLVGVRTIPGRKRLSSTAMVDRQVELRHLRDAFDDAVRTRSCRLVTVTGPAGIGKSRLARELLASIGDATVLSGRCLPYGEGITYWPIREALGPVESRLIELSLEPGVVTTIRSVLAGAAASNDDVAWAFRKLIETTAQLKPVILLFDDIQWGEDTFLDLVEHFGLVSSHAPILLLCLARPDLLEKRSNWIADLRLQPLGPGDAERLIDQALPTVELSPSIRSRILTSAGGNPLFLEEMSAVAQTTAGGGVVVPPSLRALLAARHDQLDAVEGRVLECAAVEGEVFHRGALRVLMPDERNLTRLLTGLVRKDLIAPDTAQFPGEDAFRFRHLLFRDAAYEAIPKAARAGLHERFANWLQLKMADRLSAVEAIIGYHLEQAYQFRAALGSVDAEAVTLARSAGSWLSSAGNRALASGDCRAAITLLERATRLVASDAATHVRIMPRLARAFRLAGDFRRALAVLDEAIPSAAGIGEKSTEIRARILRAAIIVDISPDASVENLLAEVERTVPLLEQLDDDESLAVAWSAIGQAHYFSMQHAKAIQAHQHAIEYARKIGDEVQVIDSEQLIRDHHWLGPTPRTEMARFADETRRSGRRSPRREARAMSMMALVEAFEGRFAEARLLLAKSRTLVETSSLYVTAAEAALLSFEIEMLGGDLIAAERQARQMYETLESVAANSQLSTAACTLGLALCEQGRFEEAQHYAEIGEKLGAKGDMETQVFRRRILARVNAEHGRRDEALRLAHEAVALVEPTDALNDRGDALIDLAEVLQVTGRPNDAFEPLQRALTLFERKGNMVSAGKVRARLASLQDVAIG